MSMNVSLWEECSNCGEASVFNFLGSESNSNGHKWKCSRCGDESIGPDPMEGD